MDYVPEPIKKIIHFIEKYNAYSTLLTLTICYIILAILVVIKRPFSYFNEYSVSSNMLLASIGFSLILGTWYSYMNKVVDVNNNISPNKSILIKLLTSLGVCAIGIGIIVFMIYGFKYLSNANDITYYMTILVNLFMVCGFLFLMSKLLFKIPAVRNFLREHKLISIITDLLFYIPCKLFVFTDYIVGNVASTKKYVYIMLAVEILLLGLYFLIPKLMNFIFTHDGKQLLKQPIFLNNEVTLGTYENLYKNDDKRESRKTEGHASSGELYGNDFAYNYALSSWIFPFSYGANLRKTTNEFTNILDYGGRPTISFNPAENKLRVSVKTNADESKVIYETDKLPLQKWNNITINYVGGTLDVFINGELSGTSQAVPYMKYDTIVSGAQNGIPGGICNVMYYPTALTQDQLEFHFNSLKNMKLPVM